MIVKHLRKHQASISAIACIALLPFASALAANKTTEDKASTRTNCESLTSFKAAGLDVIVKKATQIPAGPVPAIPYSSGYPGTLPAYCRVDGVIDERIGHDGKPYAIGFAIALPENWNGRFMMQGGGGLNGSVAQPLGTVAAGDKPALERGFAVITTDSGHQSAQGFDASFFADQEASLNFLYQAVGKVAQVGKQIIAAHYGRSAAHSYFMGCSTGGREAMLMTQRYPRFFDGVVSAAPAMRTSFSNLADRWVATSLNQVAPKDEQGKPITSRALSDSDRKLVIDSLLKSCDANDGIGDGMIFNPTGCGFDVMKLACKGPKTDACLSTEQAAAIKQGFSGPKDSRGVQVYPGFFFDTGIAEKQGIPGLLNPGGSPVGPPASDKMDIDQEELNATTAAAMMGDTANWTLLNTFSEHGGKLIFFHGVSDPWFSAQDTLRYYQQL
ncbi:MAG TPA: DUF6351 family protein, partial [Steroidobacteraceae bacterium]|nr:DUF6351 family protein [Steroidobacteraceae bacterium]